MTNDLQNQYLYDAEGRVCAVQGPSVAGVTPMTGYLYDAEGRRVGKGTITQWNCNTDSNGFTLTNEYVLGQSGEQVTEFNGDNWVHTNAYAGGQLIATYDTANGGNYNNPALHYQLADWLGTRRMQVSPAGTVEETCQSLPFGDQLNCAQSSVATADDATEHHFTGKERDTESGLDYFGARYYGSNMGRFMSPDPSGLVFASLANPQSLNLYAYVQNNPLSFTDPTGLDCAYLNSSGGYDHMNQQISSGDCGKSGGYWVDGGLQNVQIDQKNNTITLTGITGADNSGTSTASYQIQSNVFVDSWLNTDLNPAGHITIGLTGQPQMGQNPRSDADFLSNMLLGGLKNNVVPGAIQPEAGANGTTGQLRSFAMIPVTGMQAQMIQNSINQSAAAPPNYSLNPALGLDCATWAQQVLKDAGIQTGPMQPYPNDLMKQLGNQFSVLPGHQ
jgi:RHS repeat-associated protein